MEQGRENLDQIRERIAIESLVGRYIELKRAGRNFTARCPFHSEKTPSFIVSPEIQRYKCFGCGKTGDIFTFVMEYEHVDFKEALEKLAKEAGVKIEHHQSPEGKKYAILEMINKIAADFFHNKLHESIGKEAKNYLEKRGMDPQMITRFNLGYSPGDGSLVKYLRSQANFTDEQFLASGLFVIKDGSRVMREKFLRRLMFPIQNERGKVIAFSGRVLPPNELGPKYLNSPDTPIFHKKDTIYGLYQARQAIRKEDLCILCEGQIDTISSHQAGISNIVAPQGTALTEEQVAKIGRFTQNVLLLFDNDEAGQHAVERGFALCSKQGLNVYATNTGKYKDIDEAIQADPQYIHKQIAEKQDAFTYLVAAKLSSLDITNYEDNRKIVAFVNGLVQSVPDVSIRSFYIEKASQITGISKENFINKYTPTYSASPTQHQNSDIKIETPVEAKKSLTPEEYYLFLIAQTGNYDHLKKADLSYFTDTFIQGILEKLQSTGKQIREIINEVEDSTRLEQILLSNFKDITPTKNEFDNVYSRVVTSSIKVQLAKLRRQLSIEEERAYPDINEEKIDLLSKQISELSAKLQKMK